MDKMNIISVTKERVSRCDYSITLVRDGRQTFKNEIIGDAGEAAAQAVSMSARHGGLKIVASDEVMNIISNLSR